ncbi:protein-glutamate O-methyltransferase CheR [Salinispirillum sp. LH 10-3-1]|uniref:protein-glutamate O-methyltransferase n=1 Tax=Salinispirillum sp. LH 10-3-1 TaxID=2952525 RepID=A0AB38YGQ6_9GAMM
MKRTMSSSNIVQWPMASDTTFDDQQFAQWRALLEERTGMEVTAARRSFLETSIRQRMKEAGFTGFQRYFEHVSNDSIISSEWYLLVDRLTVQETRFFRDAHAMELVAEHLRAIWQRSNDPVQVWSAGCATGEEAYSLAMIMAELARRYPDQRHFSVTGSDISAPAVLKARLGTYTARKLEPVRAAWQQRYFTAEGNSMVVKPELSQRVCFTRLNVTETEQAPLQNMDVIYCQNLLIYFRRWRRRDIVTQFVDKLRPGGLLVLGPGELIDFKHDQLVAIPNKHCLAFLKKRSDSME